MAKYLEKFSANWSEDSIRLIITPSLTAKSTFFYVQEAGYFKTLPHYFTERANLNSYLIVFTLSGKGHLQYEGKHYILYKNQAFFIDCMKHHYYKTDEDNLWEILWVHFNGSASRGYYELFKSNNCPVIHLDKNTSIPSILNQIIDIHRTKNIQTELMTSKLLTDLLTELLSTINKINISNLFAPEYIQNIINYLDKHFNQRISLQQLADKFSISKFYLAKQFKKYTGFSPNEYLINTRITHAKELLQYSDIPVAQVAQKVGIDNVSHFINLFKNRVDTTPLAFRKKWQHNQ